MGDLSRLEYLHLDGNDLTGEIPGELGDLSRLKRLHLNGNRLTGPIPGELGDLTALARLHLEANGLTGEIPEELGDLGNLKSLYLSGNELRGEIPGELGDLASLKYLYLDGNQLSGSVPEDLEDLGSLVGLYICRNMLSVTLPADLRSVEGDASTCAPAPAGLEAAEGDGQVTLSWTDPGNENITGYQYRVCEPGGVGCGAWTDIPGSGAGTTSYVADELENGVDYLFQLRAENGSGAGMSAEVEARPNGAPVADAGPDQTVAEGALVTLDGSGSGDPQGELLDYAWTQTGGPKVILGPTSQGSLGFTAPTQLANNVVYVFSLVVRDARGLESSADTVTITVTAGPNDAPT
ncbi:MAG: hypothetical protein F4Y78_01850, partial [Candidatus Dadabacteria bacterium]|nr:hypothetical protein [Candidatus Dadabacteria bacterium]